MNVSFSASHHACMLQEPYDMISVYNDTSVAFDCHDEGTLCPEMLMVCSCS